MGLSMLQLAPKIRTEADAYEFLERLRSEGKPFCAHCGELDASRTSWSQRTARRVRRPGARPQSGASGSAQLPQAVLVLTGTIFHGTHISLQTWRPAATQLRNAPVATAFRVASRRVAVFEYVCVYKPTNADEYQLYQSNRPEPLKGSLLDTFNALGVAGWELTTATADSYPVDRGLGPPTIGLAHVYWFKRQLA
jgi:hypothetical protein